MNVTENHNLIPRDVLFSDPDRTMVKISPNGKLLSFLSSKNNVLNIFIAGIDDIQNVQALTDVSDERISSYFWSYEPDFICFLKDNKGDENHGLYLLNVKTKQSIQISEPNAKVGSVFIKPELPEVIVFTMNKRRADYFDVYSYSSKTKKVELVYENNEFLGFISDEQLNIRFGIKLNADGAQEIYSFHLNFETKLFDTIPYEDQLNSSYICLDKTGENIFLMDSRGSDKSKLFTVNISSSIKRELASDARCDLSDVIINPISKKLEAACFIYIKQEMQFFDKSFEKDFNFVKQKIDCECEITSRTTSDDKWIVATSNDVTAPAYYLFDRETQELTFLFNYKQSFSELTFPPMNGVEIKTRDGLTMVCYLTVPGSEKFDSQNISRNPSPLILLVHGGPQARDHWGMNHMHQWLSNRGYAVLSVNYRGSTGFGKKFTAAGNGQWSKKMHDDLIDAANWAVEKQITSQDKIAIMGGSYGGYAALVGLTFTPEFFRCAVDIVGPSNLNTLIESIPPYWKPMRRNLIKKIGGDNETEEGKAFLAEISPITYADKIVRPLLIAQGANDPRVKQAESDQIFAALENNQVPVTYVLFDDEGHGFSKPKNKLLFYAICEEFLHEHLGGQYEPYDKNMLKEYANATVKSI